MKTVGRNLLFYAKYWDEMEALYAEKDYTLLPDGWPSPDQVIQQISQVGEAAEEEANHLLDSVQTNLIEGIRNAGFLAIPIKRRTWLWERSVRVQAGEQSGRLQAGVSIDYEQDRTVFRPWVWAGGSRAFGQELANMLKRGQFDRRYGSVLLGDVEMPEFNPDTVVYIEPLQKEIFGRFLPFFRRLDAVWQLVSRTPK